MDARRIFGNKAEKLAADFLKGQGMKILARQYKTKIGEIDLITRDGDEIVFVEVKARRSNEFGYPEESVTSTKLKKIISVGQEYLRDHYFEEVPHRIDVVAIETGVDPVKITHIRAVG